MFLRSAALIALLLAGVCKDTVAQELEKVCDGGTRPISVRDTGKIFCAHGPLCGGNSSEGMCAGPQDHLLAGSYCGKVVNDTYGCIPLTLVPAIATEAGQKLEADYKPDCSILPDLAEVNVKDIGNLCARIPICSGDVQGNCPVTLTNLNATYRCESGGNGTFVCVV